MANTHDDTFSDPKSTFRIPRFAKITAGILLLLIIISFAASLFIDQDKYRALIVEKVKSSTGYDVAWEGNISLRLLPLPTVGVNDLIVKNNGEDLVTAKRVSASVSLLPLLSGKVEVAKIDLNDPVVNLQMSRNGTPNWAMTKKIETQEPNSSTPSSSEQSSQAFSIHAVNIDNGTLTYIDEAKESQHKIENANLTVKADSFEGPFNVKGDLTYNDRKLIADIQSGAIVAQDKSYPIQAKINLPDSASDFSFNGVVVTVPSISVKGDIGIQANSFEKTIHSFAPSANLPDGLKDDMVFKSSLDYSGRNVSLKDMALQIGELSWLGDVTATNIDEPENSSLSLSLKPQTGDKNLKDPLLQLLQATSISGSGKVIDGGVALKDTNITFAGNDIALNGSIKTSVKKPSLDLSLVSRRLDVDQLQKNFASLGNVAKSSSSPSAASSKKSDSKSSTGFSVPFNGALKFQIDELIASGKTYRNVGGGIESKGEGVSFNNVTADLPVNTKIAVNGVIANTSSLSGLDMGFDFSTANIEDLIKLYDQKPLPIKQTIGALSANGKVSGDIQNIIFSIATSALQFDVSAKGQVTDVTSSPQINQVQLSVSHPDVTKAIRTFNPQFTPVAGLNGSLNIASTVSWADKTTTLKGIKGNLGRTDIVGDVYIVQDKIPSISGDLRFGSLNFTDTNQTSTMSGTSSGSSSAVSSSSARWSREAVSTAWMHDFNADLKIKADNVTKNLWKLQNANLIFKLNNGNLIVEDMSAAMFGGSVKINGEMKAGADSQSPITMNWVANAQNIDARQLQSALTSKQSDTVNGNITSTQVTVAANGVSPAALVQSLSGKGTITGKNLVIKGVDAGALAQTATGSFKPLERAGSLFGSFQKGQTEFSTMDVAFTIENGVVNFGKIALDGPTAQINSTGNVNLPRWTIDLKNTMTVKNTDVPPFDFAISGPLDNPLQTGGSIIENYLRERAQKKVEKLIGKELEKRFGIPMGGDSGAAAQPAPTTGADSSAAPAPTQPTTPKDALKNILGDPNTQKALEGLFR